MVTYILENGGVILYGIFVLSILGFGVILERGVYFLKNERDSGAVLLEHIERYIKSGDRNKALEVCGKFRNTSSKIISEIIKEYETCDINGCNYEYLEEKARECALREIPKLEKNMWILGIAAHISPLAGLFGTVTGMISAFIGIATHGTGDPSVLAKGISGALLTTAAGLAVAIPSLICYNYFSKRIEDTLNGMEKNAVEFINFLRKRGQHCEGKNI